jgi:hypothetical protein
MSLALSSLAISSLHAKNNETNIKKARNEAGIYAEYFASNLKIATF